MSEKKWKNDKAPRHPPKQGSRKDVAEQVNANLQKAADEEPEHEPHVPAVDYDEYVREMPPDSFEVWKLKLCGLYREKPRDSTKTPASFAC